jgi:hypothetical protein
VARIFPPSATWTIRYPNISGTRLETSWEGEGKNDDDHDDNDDECTREPEEVVVLSYGFICQQPYARMTRKREQGEVARRKADFRGPIPSQKEHGTRLFVYLLMNAK